MLFWCSVAAELIGEGFTEGFTCDPTVPKTSISLTIF